MDEDERPSHFKDLKLTSVHHPFLQSRLTCFHNRVGYLRTYYTTKLFKQKQTSSFILPA